MTTSRLLPLFASLTLVAAGAAHAATAPHAFRATYEVQRGGSVIGQSTLTLSQDGDGTWQYRSSMKGTSGLAALLGASVKETSHFRWQDNAPEALSYDYSMDVSVKSKERHLKVDWAGKQVTVTTKKGTEHYATAPGLVERHTVPLAIAMALDDGKRSVNLPVAVRDRVQVQRYQVKGKSEVSVPAGHFQAERVDRTDDAKSFSAWYVPGKFLVPVKLAQSDGGDITMLLKSYSAR